MSRGFPSMTALLGLLAIAGYQNRDKIAELLRGAQGNPGAPAQGPQSGSSTGALPGNLGEMLKGTSIGDLLSGGLRDLVNTFKQCKANALSGLGLRYRALHSDRRLSTRTCDRWSQTRTAGSSPIARA